MDKTRRGFLKGILAAGAAPAVISAGVLMPVQEIWVPEYLRGMDEIIEQTAIVKDMLVVLHKQLALNHYNVGDFVDVAAPVETVESVSFQRV